MKWLILIAIILLIVLTGCQKEVEEPVVEIQEESSFCGDNVCDADENKCSCSEDCGECSGDVEGKECVELACKNNECKETLKENCCGNLKCEEGERNCEDCPSCNDYDVCTDDFFDIDELKCTNQEFTPCCGNNICEDGEDENKCLLDCIKNIGLEDYPDIFDGKSVVIVVGAKAPASDVTVGIDISGSLSEATMSTALDNEILSLSNRNAIVIGTPCVNEFSKELLPYQKECLEYIEEGTAVIRLYKTGDNTYAILIAGNPTSMTREAASWLRNYRSYDLEGAEVIID